MNREILPQIVLAMTIGLFAVIVAVYRTQAPPKPGVWRRGAVAALLVYAVVSVPVFVTGDDGCRTRPSVDRPGPAAAGLALVAEPQDFGRAQPNPPPGSWLPPGWQLLC